MTNLILSNSKGESITTSLIVAEVFGKNHAHVLRDIESLACSEEFRQSNFGFSSYLSSQNKELPAYEMTKDGFSFLVMGYTGEKAGQFKETFITEFNKREALLHNDDYIMIRAFEIQKNKIVQHEAKIEALEQINQRHVEVIKEQAPKVEYHDEVLNSEGLISTTIIAKDLGMSAVSLNKKLHAMGIIFRNQDAWVPYSKYQDKGLCKSKTFPYVDSNGKQKTAIQFYWTEAGRMFIMGKFSQTVNI